MSVLESFYFVFDADTSKLKKGLDDAKKTAEGFKKPLDDADDSAKNLGKSFVDLAKSVAKVGASLGALALIKTVTEDTAHHTYAVSQQARALGMATEALSAYQHAVIASGGTAEGATASLETLRQKFVEMSRFGAMVGTDAFAFRQLGLSVKDMKDSIKDPTIALQKLSNVFGGLNNTQQLFIGKKLGLDQGTIALLSQGRQAFDAMIEKQKEFGVVTQAQADAARKFELAQISLGMTLETVKREITTALLPAFTWMYDKIEKIIQFLRNHQTFTIAFFSTLGAVLAAVVVPALISAAIAMWAFLAPVLAIAAPVIALAAAFALAADDIDNFLSGSLSVIGELSKKWPELGRTIRSVFAELKHDMIVLKSLWQYLADLKDVGAKQASINFQKNISEKLAEAGESADSLRVNDHPIGYQPGAVAAAKAAEAKYGIPAAVTMAQYELESGNGAHMPAGSNNPFGIKAAAGQDYVLAKTTEVINGQAVQVMARFAKFNSIADAFDAHAKLLATGAAYSGARAHAGDPLAFASALQGTYATDPQYGAKLRAIIMRQQSNNLGGLLTSGQGQLNAASSNPLVSSTSGSIMTSNSSRSNSLSIGAVNVNTQATDSDKIAASLGLSLNSHMRNMLDQNDDGIAI